MVPTSLRELPKPSRTPGKSQTPVLQNLICHRKSPEQIFICLVCPISPFWGGHPGCEVAHVNFPQKCPVAVQWPVHGLHTTVAGESGRADRYHLSWRMDSYQAGHTSSKIMGAVGGNPALRFVGGNIKKQIG